MAKILKIKLYSCKVVETGLSLGAKIGIGIGATALGLVGAVVAAPVVLAGAGFTAAGVASGSLAASFMSWTGPIAAGSLFASLQSAGAAGLGIAGLGAAAAGGAAVGGAVGGLVAGGVKISIPVKKLEETFAYYDSDRRDFVSYYDFKRIISALKIQLTEKEIRSSFKSATGKEAGHISYEEFLSIFGVTLLRGRELEEILKKVFMTANNNETEMSLKELETMLEKIGVNVRSEDIISAYQSATGLTENVTLKNRVTLRNFLIMCGFCVEEK